jgi:quercetin dioxygenase-like cupin family protein
MLSRRKFGACAICAVAGFAATAVDANAQSPSGLKRTILQKTEFPGDKYATVLVAVDIEPGFFVAWHTHPGVESAYLVEGEIELAVKGQATKTLKAGDGAQIPPETPHSARNGSKPAKLAVTYVVEKDKPLASPAAAPA